MSESGPALPSLSQWVQNHLTAIIKARPGPDQERALDAFLAADSVVIVNGMQSPRSNSSSPSASEDEVESEENPASNSSISFPSVLEVPKVPGDNITAGFVGIFYNATILGGPVTRYVTASVYLQIDQDPSLPLSESDRRRVIKCNEVLMVEPPISH